MCLIRSNYVVAQLVHIIYFVQWNVISLVIRIVVFPFLPLPGVFPQNYSKKKLPK